MIGDLYSSGDILSGNSVLFYVPLSRIVSPPVSWKTERNVNDLFSIPLHLCAPDTILKGLLPCCPTVAVFGIISLFPCLGNCCLPPAAVLT
jgi:hypothetical protein